MFRKIEAESVLFETTKNEFLSLYNQFKRYVEIETQIKAKAKDGKSGTASSYARYLIRLIIFYREISQNTYNTFSNKEEINKMKEVFSSQEFKKYNNRENNFPGSTLKKFETYIKYKESISEQSLYVINDLNIDQDTQYDSNQTPNDFIVYEDTVEYKTEKKKKISVDNISFYPRNIKESKKAKYTAKWQCEYDESHQTFISKSDYKNYMESHHLIPMSYQDFFDYTLDFADNIICLCPNCHRQIHHATDEKKKEMISFLYKKRHNVYPEYGIDINLSLLFFMYEIDKELF